jgi:hypothetical protein
MDKHRKTLPEIKGFNALSDAWFAGKIETVPIDSFS